MLKQLLALAVGAATLAACMSAEETSAVETEAEEFYARQTARDDAGILADATDGFRAAATLADLERLNSAVRAAPACSAPTRNTAFFNNSRTTSGHFITVSYSRQCETGDLAETFVFQMNGGEAKLHNYNIGGMALFPPAPPPHAPPITEQNPPAPEQPPA